MMTDTETSRRILGTAWPQHMNKVVAEVMTENIKTVGMPQWSEADQTLAKAIQSELKSELKPLQDKVGTLEDPPKEFRGGGSDDIGDISWNVPTITLRYPSNIPNLPGHNWSNAIAMATPIAHKGVTAGAKAQAMTVLDLLLRKELVEKAWAYFRDVQTKDVKYTPFIKDEPPATHLNVGIMEKYRPEMRKYYFDSSKYKTLLEQLGIQYPTVRKTSVAEK
jgi:aminobenzoyl-glutamate utilization protein B